MSATNRGTIRKLQDYYPTPDWCVDAILSRMLTYKVTTSLEPCRGNGVIYNKLPGERQWCELSEGMDYFDWDYSDLDLILTNPPFSLAMEFLKKSLQEASTVVYLLRLNFLGSRKRAEFWKQNPPKHLYVLSQRPSFTGKGTDATEYAWFVWDKACVMKDSPGIHIL